MIFFKWCLQYDILEWRFISVIILLSDHREIQAAQAKSQAEKKLKRAW